MASPEYLARLNAIPAFYELFTPEPAPTVTEEPTAAPLASDPWEDTVIGTDDYGDEVRISAKDRMEHTLLLGKTGQGKSVLMRYLMRQDLLAGRGFTCFDPHGSLLEGVIRDIPLSRQDDVIYLDPSDDAYPFGLNLFEAPRSLRPIARSNVADQLVQVFQKTWDGPWATTTGDWLKIIASTFLQNRHGTMANIPTLLQDRHYRDAYLANVRDIQTLSAWKAETNARTGELSMTDLKPTLRRMRGFLMNPVLENIVGQQKTTLNFSRWMQENKIVLIRLPSEGDDSIGEKPAELLGCVMMQLILKAAFSRKVGDPLYPVYCDEFQHFVTPDMPKIIRNVRKFGVGLFLATQAIADLDDAIRTGILGVGTLLAYQTTEPDARIIAGEFRRGVELDDDWQPEIKTHISGGETYRTEETVYKRPNKAEQASRIANLQGLLGKGRCLVKTSKGEFVVTIPNVEAMPVEYPTVKRGIVIRNTRERYCRPREEVEAEIREELMPEHGDDEAIYDELPPAF